MRSSINLLLEKNRLPLPPVELTGPLEAAVRARAAERARAPQPTAQPQPTPAAPETGQTGQEPLTAENPPATQAEPKAEVKEPVPEKKAAPPPPPPARAVAVNVKTSVAGAQVVVDRNPGWSCVAPCSIQLPRGRHVAVASLAGYRSYPKIFEVASDSPQVDIQLRQITGTLLISSDPTGAEVLIDGRAVPGATNMQYDVPPGFHLVLVRKQGAGTGERSVRVQEGGLHPVHFILHSEGIERSRLSVRSNPAGAEIVVNDNRRIGTTPADVDLAPGRYRVAVSRNGYRPVIQEIELTPGKPQSLEVTLSPQN